MNVVYRLHGPHACSVVQGLAERRCDGHVQSYFCRDRQLQPTIQKLSEQFEVAKKEKRTSTMPPHKEGARMRSHHTAFKEKVRDTVLFAVVLFLFFPGAMFLLGLVSGLPIALISGLLTLYNLVALFVLVALGFARIERVLGRN